MTILDCSVTGCMYNEANCCHKGNIRIFFPKESCNLRTVYLFCPDTMYNPLFIQEFQKLRGGIFQIAFNMDVPDMSGQPVQHHASKNKSYKKIFSFPCAQKKKGYPVLFQNMNMYPCLSQDWLELSEIPYGKLTHQFVLGSFLYFPQLEASCPAQV